MPFPPGPPGPRTARAGFRRWSSSTGRTRRSRRRCRPCSQRAPPPRPGAWAGRLAHPHHAQGEGGALHEPQQPGHPLRLVLPRHRVLAEKRQPHEPGRGAPVPGQALGAAAGKALGQVLVPEGEALPVQVPDPGVIEEVRPVPGIAGAVGHDPQGPPVEVQAVGVGLGDDHLPGPVAEGPVEGRHRTQQRPGHQGQMPAPAPPPPPPPWRTGPAGGRPRRAAGWGRRRGPGAS